MFKHYRKRTLSRGANFSVATTDDIKYMWAAYRKGSLDQEVFGDYMPDGLDPQSFGSMFELFLLDAGLDCYIMSAHNKDGLKPVGVVLVWKRGRLMEIYRFIWFEWATKRNILETSLNFVNQFRSTVHEPTGKKHKLIGFVEQDNISLYEHLIKYKVLRRIGKSYDFFNDSPAMVYETTK